MAACKRAVIQKGCCFGGVALGLWMKLLRKSASDDITEGKGALQPRPTGARKERIA